MPAYIDSSQTFVIQAVPIADKVAINFGGVHGEMVESWQVNLNLKGSIQATSLVFNFIHHYAKLTGNYIHT